MKYGLLLSLLVLVCYTDGIAQQDSIVNSEALLGTMTVRKKATEIAGIKQDNKLILVVEVSYPNGRKSWQTLSGAQLSIAGTPMAAITNASGLGGLAFDSTFLSLLRPNDTLQLNVLLQNQVVASRNITSADFAEIYTITLDKSAVKGLVPERRKRLNFISPRSSRMPEVTSVLSKVGE